MQTKPLVLSLILTLAPGVVAAQTLGASTRETRRTRFTLEAPAGSTTRGGDVESASVGFSPLPWLTLLVRGERFHNPTRIEYFPNGGSISRGFTTHLLAGEIRVGTPASGRVSPYAALGMGAGTWGSNVDRLYPERDSGPVRTAYACAWAAT